MLQTTIETTGIQAHFAAAVPNEAGRMLATARRILGTHEDAEDAVQEALLQAHRGLDRFQGESLISTWLHRIVVNASLMKLRSRRRKPEQSLDDLLPESEDDGAWADLLPGLERPIDEVVASAECRAIVRNAIDRLPASYREVVVLRDLEGFDTDETAELLDSTPNAVKVRLHRARQALRALLDPELPHG